MAFNSIIPPTGPITVQQIINEFDYRFKSVLNGVNPGPDERYIANEVDGNLIFDIGLDSGLSLTLSNNTIDLENADKGSEQFIFKTINHIDGFNDPEVIQSTISATTNNEQFTLISSKNIGIQFLPDNQIKFELINLGEDGGLNSDFLDGLSSEEFVQRFKADETFEGTGTFTFTQSDVNMQQSLSVQNNVTINGDLSVNGTTTTVNTEEISIKDNVVLLNSNQTGTPDSILESGLEIERGNFPNSRLIWDEEFDEWKVSYGDSPETLYNIQTPTNLFYYKNIETFDRLGSSNGVISPNTYADKLNIKAGDKIFITNEPDGLVINSEGGINSENWSFVETGIANDNLFIQYNGVDKFLFNSLGEFHADGDIVAFSTSVPSDSRLKDNQEILPLEEAKKRVFSLQAKTFDWNFGPNKGESDFGFIAQEVKEIIPEMVKTQNSPFFGVEDAKTVDYAKLVTLLTEVVKDQENRINELENKLNKLGGL